MQQQRLLANPGTVTADDPSFFRDAMGISSV